MSISQAQEVAQMAIKAKEAGTAAGKLVEEARDELKATEIVLSKLDIEIGELMSMIEECKSGDVNADNLAGDSAATGTVDMKDLETGTHALEAQTSRCKGTASFANWDLHVLLGASNVIVLGK